MIAHGMERREQGPTQVPQMGGAGKVLGATPVGRLGRRLQSAHGGGCGCAKRDEQAR